MFLFKLVPIMFILIGVLNVLFPRASWFMKYGWQYKNAEPSQAALITARIGGIIAIIIGIFILASGFPNIGTPAGFITD
ncbi:DUF6199 family natural product biosynthesis protein [Cohnella silvisoli]|uniref:DUF6199 domain-containing protein n=1 Tax=Cohnella silvisoli TaxID=2873699 RepID=A0ABV1KQK0_9BACL|nr:DUF6199 family natural product biosynthesis protein [Cohnella silvisoli]MCD9022188.1 hypothetical protein [Cohnella silvisoli]